MNRVTTIITGDSTQLTEAQRRVVESAEVRSPTPRAAAADEYRQTARCSHTAASQTH
jgi:hypothetical protein